MANPLFPSSKSSGVQAAYEQAALMDDTDEMLAKKSAAKNKDTSFVAISTSERGQKISLWIFIVLAAAFMLLFFGFLV